MFASKLGNAVYIGFLALVAYIGLIFPIDIVAITIGNFISNALISVAQIFIK